MEHNSLCNSLLKWLETFPGREGIAVPQLTDGVVMATVLHQIAPEYFSQFWLAKIKEDVGDNWRLKVSNLRKVLQGIVDYFQEQLNQNIKHFPLPDLNKIGEHNDEEELGRMLQLILGCAVNCESKQQYIEAIMNMEERVQKVIMEAIQELMLRESSPGLLGAEGDQRTDLGPASFHPHIKTVLEQLETATQAKDEMMQRCLELEQQLSVLSEEKTTLSSENEKLLNRLDALESGGDLGTSTLRYKDLKKQIDGLQDELYKLETSRDEYRTKTEMLERENQEIQARNEELQQLADEARSLKDEVDALREMSERAVVYEGTMETYKKKLEELSDLKRQVRILEEKNSDYMQHNMELEEEVKKSGTWRPQLELYKKQVTDLHQKLADEAKKTDRQIFENKKLSEKMEAITQEKDRLTMERDQLKESLEELKCHISTLTSPDTTSRPPSDLSDVDLLEVIPHDIRQKLIRLQHENTMLKQRAAEGDSTEQLPVLQTLVSDLQERQNSLTQENRWDSKGEISQSLPIHRPGSTSPPSNSTFSLLDAYFSVDPNRKMKLFKRNLKWASESDLLILRQPKGLLPSNFLSSTLPLKQPRSLPPMPVPSFTSFATQTSKESPIVIRHIHEFKMSPSPTNEDSGCCRTSPSSCEGCEDNGCTRGHSPDYSGTLDSGVSGIYCGTLESGVSGVFRCLSPVIPSIVEECTTHHVSDIIPALGGQRVSSPGVMHHSHPAHTSCMHCCSPHASHGEDTGDMCGREGGRGCCLSPLPPPRPHTVCSYSSPYHYQNATSPTPTSLLPTLPGSPPLSPLPTCSPLTLITSSFCTSVTESSQQSVVAGLSYKPTKEGVIHSLTLSTSPSAITSYTNTGPFPVSSPPGRRSSSGFSRTSLPPESPTPHNSPRLPNSINATRSRANKTSLTTITLADQTSNVLDVPITQSVLAGRANPQEKRQISPERNTNQDIILRTLEDESLLNGNYKGFSDSQRNGEESTLHCSSDSSESSNNYKCSVRESAPVIGTMKSSQIPERKSSIPRGNAHDVAPKSKNNTPANEEIIKKTEPISKVHKDSRPPSLQEKKLQLNSNVGLPPVVKQNNEQTVLRNTPKESKINASVEKKSSPNISKSRAPTLANTAGTKPSHTPKNNPNSRNNSPRTFKKNGMDPLSSNKSNNHVKFRDPVVSQVKQNDHQTSISNYSPKSPRERMSPLKTTLVTASHSKGPVPVTATTRTSIPTVTSPNAVRLNSSEKKKNPPVKLLSDTLFTRFVVAPESEKALGKERFTSDTDTDLDTLERRLTFGMYDAPLVSSESCTSISPDDGDEDPSATEYYTDNDVGEYNPNQYKANIDDNKNNKMDRNLIDDHPNTVNDDEDDSTSLLRTYSFFRKQGKLKKQRKLNGKEMIPPPVGGGVVKTKNRSAKHVVAETFNAMFTLCTP